MRRGRIKKYLIFAKSAVQTTIAYRGQVLLWVFGSIVNAVLMGLVWWAVYKFSDGDVIGGYTFPQMLLYVVLSAVVGELTFSETMGLIGDDVRDGLIGIRLMKPVSYRAQLAFTSLGTFIARFVIVCVPITFVGTLIAVYAFGFTGLVWYNVLLFVPSCLLAAMLSDAVSFLFGQLAFRTQAMFGIHSMSQVIMNFLSGAIVPLSLFPAWAQTALAYTPFPSIASLPVRLFLGDMAIAEVAVSFAVTLGWIIVLNVLGQLAFKSSVRKVVVFGG